MPTDACQFSMSAAAAERCSGPAPVIAAYSAPSDLKAAPLSKSTAAAVIPSKT